MVKTDTVILLSALGLGVILLNQRTGNVIGSRVGQFVGGTTSGVVQGTIEGLLVQPYEWAKNYKGYIPIIDDAAKALLNIKNLGDSSKWFG